MQPLAEHEITTGTGDAALLRSYVVAGDKVAMEELFMKHAKSAYRLAFGFLKNTADAEDAVQSAFLAVLNNCEQYRGESSVKGWIMKIVRNTCLKKIRSAASQNRREVLANELLRAPEAESEEQKTLLQNLSRALNSLPEKYRMPVWLRYFEGLSFHDVADVLALTETTARKHVSRGIERLREDMAATGQVAGIAAITGAIPSLEAVMPPSTLISGISNLVFGFTPTISAGIGVAGEGGLLSTKILGTIVNGGLGMKIAAGVALAGAIAGGVVLVNPGNSQQVPPAKQPAVAVSSRTETTKTDQAYARYEDTFRDAEHVKGRAMRLDLQIVAIKALQGLNLSREQMEKILPIARAAFEKVRAHEKYMLPFREEERVTKCVIVKDAIMREDLSDPVPGAVAGNFEPKMWGTVNRFPHGWDVKLSYDGPCRTNCKAFMTAIEQAAKDVTAILTDEQREKMQISWKNWDKVTEINKQLLGAEVTLPGMGGSVVVQDGYGPGKTAMRLVGKYRIMNAAVNPQLTRVSGTDWSYSSPIVGLLMTPACVHYLEKQLGQKPTVDLDSAEDVDTAMKLQYAFGYSERGDSEVPGVNWVKGIHLTQEQTEFALRLCRAMLPHYQALETSRLTALRAYEISQKKIRDALVAGQPVPQELAKESETLRPKAWITPSDIIHWHGLPPEADKIAAELENNLSLGQKVALTSAIWCFPPWAVFTDPVNVGVPRAGPAGDERLKKLRTIPEKDFPAVQAALVEEVLKNFKGGKASDEEKAGERARLMTFTRHIRDMSDSDYIVNTVKWAAVLRGVEAKEENPWGAPVERNEWFDAKIMAGLDDALRYKAHIILAPFFIPVYETRLALMQEARSKPRPPTDLEKLKQIAEPAKKQ